jgi:hypothetical protein
MAFQLESMILFSKLYSMILLVAVMSNLHKSSWSRGIMTI